MRRRYFELVGQGVNGDDAANMAEEDELRHRLAVFISEQPEHNGPISLDELLEEHELPPPE